MRPGDNEGSGAPDTPPFEGIIGPSARGPGALCALGRAASVVQEQYLQRSRAIYLNMRRAGLLNRRL